MRSSAALIGGDLRLIRIMPGRIGDECIGERIAQTCRATARSFCEIAFNELHTAAQIIQRDVLAREISDGGFPLNERRGDGGLALRNGKANTANACARINKMALCGIERGAEQDRIRPDAMSAAQLQQTQPP